MPALIQQLMAIFFAGVILIAKMAVTRRNPLEKERGMDFWYDVIDWIGGYPYEYATPQLVEAFVQAHGFRLRRMIPAQVPTGCNEFVFEKFSR
jgi:2-polyprenyl-6-hydroxyphenyl methylase/3-demethylubiquinone-9 3-methyltransferase